MEKLTQLWSGNQLAFAVAAMVMLAVVLLMVRAGTKKYGKKVDPALAEDLAKGNYEVAAERELKAGRLRSAYDLFVRAQQPMRAAQIAVRQGRLQDAAELFERAGSRRRAADLYNQVGMGLKAEELLAEEQRVAQEREEQKAALRKRLQESPGDEEDVASLDRTPAPSLRRSSSTPAPVSSAPTAPASSESAPGKLDLSDVAPTPPAAELDLGSEAKPATPSLLGLQALMDETAQKAASQVLALAATQASMASLAAAAAKSIVVRGVEQEDLALRYVADAAVSEAREGPPIADLERELAARGSGPGSEEVLYRLGLALVAAGRWNDARDAFLRAEQAVPGYRDAAARAQELVRWQGAVGKTQFSLSRADGRATRYTLLGELGRGGMAVVYRARDEALGREVALKFMAEGMGNDPAAVALFQREARAVAQLAHRNIVTLYDVGEQAGKSFISMELVDGTTVEKMLQKEGKLSTPKTAAIIEQVLAALEFAHGKKTIHRDIKPANIMVTRDGAVKVMDFGLAKRVEGPDKTTLIAGSPPYMAPEQFVGKNMDGRTDLFAVGVSLYEMLTGQLPFPGLARFDPPKPMRALAPDIPVALDAVVMRALNFDKEKRFPSAADMAVPLRHLLASSGPVLLGSAPVAGAPSPAAETASSSPPAGSAPDEARPAVEPLPLGGAKPREEELFLEELKPAVETLSFGETKPAVEPLSFGEAKPAVEQVLVDSDPSARPAPGAPAPPPAIVEGLPEPSPRSGRTTPRTPIPVVGPSIGAYRMVRPTEPEEVFTPAPGVRTPQPQRPRRPSGELGSGERRRPTPAPTPRPRLSLSAKSGTGEPSTPRPRTPSAETGRPDGPAPKTPSPGPGTGPKGTILGIGRR